MVPGITTSTSEDCQLNYRRPKRKKMQNPRWQQLEKQERKDEVIQKRRKQNEKKKR